MSQQQSGSKSQQPAADAKAPKKPEAPLEEKQLEQVTGGTGSLTNACTTGKHIPNGTITV